MKFLYIFLFIAINFSAQTIEIEYKYHELLQPKNLPRDEVHKLFNVNDEFSVYVVEKEQNNSKIPGYLPPSQPESLITYKKFDQDSIYTVYPYGYNYIYVKEDLPKINWKIANDIKKILDFECKKATAEYRGRKYVAYFTEKIPTTDGPWKFSGLPGTILEIYDSEKKLTIEAVAVKVSTETKNYDQYLLNLRKKKMRTYDEFVKLSIQMHARILSSMNANLPNNSDVVISANFIKNYPQQIELVDVEKYK